MLFPFSEKILSSLLETLHLALPVRFCPRWGVDFFCGNPPTALLTARCVHLGQPPLCVGALGSDVFDIHLCPHLPIPRDIRICSPSIRNIRPRPHSCPNRKPHPIGGGCNSVSLPCTDVIGSFDFTSISISPAITGAVKSSSLLRCRLLLAPCSFVAFVSDTTSLRVCYCLLM